MTEPVKFEIAKLLKEKGFDVVTQKYFRYDGKERENKPTNWNEDVGFFSRPTIAEVVMWLYKKHGIWLHVAREEDNYFYCYTDLEHGGGDKGMLKSNSPTEAYEAAIDYVLKNLI